MMAAVLVLAGLAFTAFVFVFVALALVLKLAFRILFFPLYLLKFLVTAVVMVVVGPVLALVGIVLALVFGVLLSIPLIPLAAVAALVWLLVKSNQRPAVA
jgi:hypothetical protein